MFNEFIRRYEKNSIFISILMLILGLLLVFKPVESALVVVYMFGTFILVDGIIHMVSYFKTKADIRVMNFEFAEGILEILSGIIILFNAKYLLSFLAILLGIWIIIKSIAKMQMALNIKIYEQSSWGLVLAFAIISLIIGIFIVLNPMIGYLTVSFIGAYIIVNEILNIIESIYTLNKLK